MTTAPPTGGAPADVLRDSPLRGQSLRPPRAKQIQPAQTQRGEEHSKDGAGRAASVRCRDDHEGEADSEERQCEHRCRPAMEIKAAAGLRPATIITRHGACL